MEYNFRYFCYLAIHIFVEYTSTRFVKHAGFLCNSCDIFSWDYYHWPTNVL
jgi:hypothetical protein